MKEGTHLTVMPATLQLGAVLNQIQDGFERVISNGSRTLNKSGRNYCITDKELLAIRYFTGYYRQYPLGRKFKVRTDHQALVWLFRLKEPKGRIVRWTEILSPHDLEIEYRPGQKHQNADAMSRIRNPRDCNCGDQDMLEPLKCGPCKKCIKKTEDMIGQTLPETKDGESQETREKEAKVSKVTTRTSALQGPIQNVGIYSVTARMQQEQVIEWCKHGSRPDYREMTTQCPEPRHYWHFWTALSLVNGIFYIYIPYNSSRTS